MLIDASGSREAWYVPPRFLARFGLHGQRRVSARRGGWRIL